MVEIGYALSTEEHAAPALLEYARRAEEAGFDFVSVSDHFHPWTRTEGQSPSDWVLLGGIAAVTHRVRVQTGVTCPILRVHPALVAQWAATAASLMEGRFTLGIGSGEALNEHVLGQRWPPATVRIAMMREAIGIIRALWTGETTDHRGPYYVVEKARLFSLPETPPPVLVSATGPIAAKVAAECGDELILPFGAPEHLREVLGAFDAAGGAGKPRMTQVSTCYDEDEARAREVAYRWWPIAANKGQLNRELPGPVHYEQLARMTTPEQVCRKTVCGADPERFVARVREAEGFGFGRVLVHNVGPGQEKFFRFAKEELLPALR